MKRGLCSIGRGNKSRREHGAEFRRRRRRRRRFCSRLKFLVTKSSEFPRTLFNSERIKCKMANVTTYLLFSFTSLISKNYESQYCIIIYIGISSLL